MESALSEPKDLLERSPDLPDGLRSVASSRARAHRSPGMQILAWPARCAGNPYIDLLYRHIEALGADVIHFSPARLLRSRPSIWHLHWPDEDVSYPSAARSAVRGLAVVALMTFARLRGTRIVWTVHNLQAHERFHPRLERWFWRFFIRRLDGYITLTAGSRAAAQERFPGLRDLPGFVVPHGHYREVYPMRATREEARARLGIAQDARVIGFLGQIREYKNVPHLIRAFRDLAAPGTVLLIAGSPDTGKMEHDVKTAAEGDARVLLALRFIAEDEVQLYLRASDLVVLPYREILNSGSALLALSFDVPVLVPEKGAMRELRERVGEQWVRTYTGEVTAEVLGEALDWAHASGQSPCTALDQLSWPRLAGETLDAFREIHSGATPRGLRGS